MSVDETRNYTKALRIRDQLWRGRSRRQVRCVGDQQRYRHAAMQAYTHTDNASKYTNQPTKRETGVSGVGWGTQARQCIKNQHTERTKQNVYSGGLQVVTKPPF